MTVSRHLFFPKLLGVSAFCLVLAGHAHAGTVAGALTDRNGQASLNNLPAGRYEVKAWAPYMFGTLIAQTVQVTASGTTPVKFQFN